MNRLSLLFITLCALSIPRMAAASDHDLEDALKQQFKDKILLLRHPMGDESLHFDAQGKALRQRLEGSWTLYGAVQIQKIELGRNKLRLQGMRLFVRKAPRGPAPFEFERFSPLPPIRPFVTIEISFDQPLVSAEQATALLGNVFALNKEDFLDSVPGFWREYLAANFNYDPGQSKEMEFTPGETGNRNSARSQSRTSQPATGQENQAPLGRIYGVGPGVESPKIRFSPEPDFTEAARREQYQGFLVLRLVVDQTGAVRNVQVVKPLGLGLDESGVAKIKTWTFEPAMHDGKPVPVEMNVEVSFRLY